MPKIEDVELPVVTSNIDLNQLKNDLKALTSTPEGMIEAAIWIKRQADIAEDLSECVDILKQKLMEFYQGQDADKRDTRRTKVGIAPYTDKGSKYVIIDRDTTVEQLTDEQLRISYVPNVKNLETILKPEMFERLTKTVDTPARVSLKDLTNDNYEELDF